MNARHIARAAYARHLYRLSERLEHLARLGRGGLLDPEDLAELWKIQRAALELSRLLDPAPKPAPPVPDFFDEKK